jgi:hypothetical protein
MVDFPGRFMRRLCPMMRYINPQLQKIAAVRQTVHSRATLMDAW